MIGYFWTFYIVLLGEERRLGFNCTAYKNILRGNPCSGVRGYQ